MTTIASSSQASSSGVLARIEKALKYAVFTFGLLFQVFGGALVLLSTYVLFFWSEGDFYPQTMAQCMAGALTGSLMIAVGIALIMGSTFMRPRW